MGLDKGPGGYKSGYGNNLARTKPIVRFERSGVCGGCLGWNERGSWISIAGGYRCCERCRRRSREKGLFPIWRRTDLFGYRDFVKYDIGSNYYGAQPVVFKKCSHNGSCGRSEEHTSELQSLMRISYAVFCLKKKKTNKKI